MATAKQYWSAADGLAYLALSNGISQWWELNFSQHAMVREAAALWEDVCNVDWIEAIDDDALAQQATTFITETLLGIPINSYWELSLTSDWTRIAVGNIADSSKAGLNATRGANNAYHEIYIDTADDGLSTFGRGSRAFYTVLHEMGHSMGFGHVNGDRTQTVMAASESNDSTTWYASTPMTLDVDAAIAAFGAKTTTRTGSDVYGFNASFSNGGYRGVYDFNVNKRP